MLLVWLVPVLIIGALVVLGIYIAVMRSRPDDATPEDTHPDSKPPGRDDRRDTRVHPVNPPPLF